MFFVLVVFCWSLSFICVNSDALTDIDRTGEGYTYLILPEMNLEFLVQKSKVQTW